MQTKSPQDKVKICIDCGEEFKFTESEQKFFKDLGYTEPKRCPSCRRIKKAERTRNEQT